MNTLRQLMPAPGAVRPRTTHREDVITVVLGLWFTVGLILDAWAHNNLVGLESFFTPWHGVFYTGFLAIAGWICWLLWKNRRAAWPTADDIPVGYGLGVLGLPLFGAAGMGDMMWHEIWGVETDLKILFSPTHLFLIAAMVLIVTSPLRAAWADPDDTARTRLGPLVPAILSTAFAAALVLLFLQYANALVWRPDTIVRSLSEYDPAGFYGGDPVQLMTSIVVTNVVLMVPLLLLARRWQLPPGTATLMVLPALVLSGAITTMEEPTAVIAVLLGAVLADVLIAAVRPGPTRGAAVLTFATLSPLITWSIYLGAASIQAGNLPTVTEYWTGLPLTMALQGLLLAVLSKGRAEPATVTVGEPERDRLELVTSDA